VGTDLGPDSGSDFCDGSDVSLHIFPRLDELATLAAVDLLGTGTSCLVWTSSAPLQQVSMKYLDFTKGRKPHLLTGTRNNLGAESKITYAPSTKFFLDDKEQGRHWFTSLPFPVHCVEKVEAWDHLSRSRFVSKYAYHHGYYDGVEREYRGFAFVEQWDTEEFNLISPDIAENWDSAWYSPPVHTKTWYHNGAFLEGRSLVAALATEYFRQDTDDGEFVNDLLDESVISAKLSYEICRESCRAMTGQTLRHEVYANDGSTKAKFPYTVSESNYTLRVLQQPEDSHGHSIITVNPRESI